MLFAQLLHLMRGEIDDDHAPVRTQDTCRLAQGSRRILGEMQYLMQDREIETLIADRNVVHVAEADLTMADFACREARSCDRQHLWREIDAEPSLDMWREDLENAPGPGADIEKIADPVRLEQTEQPALDFLLGHIERADAVPVRCIGPEIGGSRLGASGADIGETVEIALMLEIVVGEEIDDRPSEMAELPCLDQPVEDPRALPEAVEESGIGKQLQMTRHARLALAQDLRQLGDGELAMAEQTKDAKACRLAGSSERGKKIVHENPGYRPDKTGRPLSSNYINISLCVVNSRIPATFAHGFTIRSAAIHQAYCRLSVAVEVCYDLSDHPWCQKTRPCSGATIGGTVLNARPSVLAAGLRLGLLGAILLLLAACASRPPESDPAALAAYEEANDPLEPFNRAMWKFNSALDTVIVKPVTWLYRAVLPAPVRKAISNIYENAKMPLVIVNALLQGDPDRAGIATQRFLANTLLGLGGIADPASKFGIEKIDEDFGQTLAVWGIGDGPYLVLPFIGPSNPRDFVGFVGDSLSEPVGLGLDIADERAARYSWTGVSIIETRDRNWDVIKEVWKAEDPYSFARSAFRQRRHFLITNGAAGQSTAEEDLFESDFGDFPEHEPVEEPPAPDFRLR